ncbi:hypothetical protein [Hymenobacter tenuis]
MKLLTIVLSSGLLLFTTFCTKKDSITPKHVATKNEFLLATKWQLTSYTTRLKVSTVAEFSPDQVPEEGYNSISDWTKDDSWQFISNQSFIVDEGGTKFSSSTPQSRSGSWTLTPDAKTLSITIDRNLHTYEVLALDASTLKIRERYDTPEDFTVEIVMTFKPL